MRIAFLAALSFVGACSVDGPNHVNTDASADDDASPDANVDGQPGTCAELIAFDRSDGIYAVKPDGSGLHSIVTSGAEIEPAWSPDGTRVLFQRKMEDLTTDIFVSNADGTGLANLTDAPGDDTYPVWSPDGTMIAFTTERNYSGSGSDAYVMNADGSSPTLLATSACCTTWSPDSQKIALGSYAVNSRFQIYTVDPNGQNLTNISNNTARDNSPVWSPDGTKIAFTSLRGGFGVQVFVMNADGSQQRNLTPNFAGASGHTWSPDSSLVAFSGSVSVDAESDVFVVEPSANGLVNLTASEPKADQSPQWSPVGDQIVFVSNRDDNDELYRINLDGTGALRLTTSDFFSERNASWSTCAQR